MKEKGSILKLFIADDSAIVVERLIAMLSEIPEIKIVGQAQKPLEAINSIQRLKPDAVILDIRLRGGSGIDVLQSIKKDNPALLVIILTNYPYPQYRKKCLDTGADFFFDKSTEFEKISKVFKKLISDSSKRSEPNTKGFKRNHC
jgi:DNA-binding NarL/FixJ family response regulator